MHWKKALQGMTPYKPGRSIDEVKELYNLDEVVKLASNENPYGTVPAVRDYFASAEIEFEVYPDGHATDLRKKMAEKLEVAEDNLLFGNGSDEIIVMITRALLGAETNTIVATPTFSQYAHAAKIEGAEIKEIPLINGHHDLDGFLQAIDERTSVMWLCSPNNPTGNLIDGKRLIDFLEKVPKNILVVLDEAYYEYVVDKNYIETVKLIDRYSNLIVLRTFSKAYGLAAFRIGYGISQPEVITNLNIVRSPFNITTAGLRLAEMSLEDDKFINNCSKLNREQMERFEQYAADNNLHMFDSQANFVLIEVPGIANEAAEKLLEQGFIVRSGDALGTPGYIRATIGTENQNTGFFKAFDVLIESAGSPK